MGLCFGCFSVDKCICKEEERLTSEEAHAKAVEAAQKRSGATLGMISSGQQTRMGSEYYQSSMQADVMVVTERERAGDIGLFGNNIEFRPALSKVWFS
ncbi:hypothetical protein D0Y65_041740 [Glycine soja]|uniref:Uncharacterized protein n=1 Tax=Glycine soja TaxID=3848 RepID=A0A445GX16_GLYSO|nr:hypothetical protein D0Y65_041740 [Glycine soja]